MPSLSLLRRGSRSQSRDNATNGTPPTANRKGHDRSKSDGERLSKREFLQNLLGRSRAQTSSSAQTQEPVSSQSAPSQIQRGHADSNGSSAGLASPRGEEARKAQVGGGFGVDVPTAAHQAATSKPHDSARSSAAAVPARSSPPLNANKPLPSPPNLGAEQSNGPVPKPVLKLDKIMATLGESEIERLFSGAPQYFARSEGHFTGAPHPSVAFPWDEVLEIRDLCDYVQIEDYAWRCITAWPHVTRDCLVARSGKDKKKAHFYPRCRERPNMLSMQGLEKGTMGYQAALEIAVGDALQEEQSGFDSLGSKASIVVEQRQKMLTSKDGLRHLEESAILDQLIKNCDRYKSNRIHRNISSTLYNELFLGILHPPSRVLDHRDPYSLSVQIQALLKVLATPNVWIDFSHVEWRIRLGQILWGSYEGDEVETDVDIEHAETNEERKEERYWLLLQILLACELLIRLDAITEGEELGIESIRPAEIHRFEKDATCSVKWSMHLARAWLENIKVVETEVDTSQQAHDRGHLSGWLASLTGRMTLHGHANGHHGSKLPVYTVQGQNPQRQVDGLTHFAKKLRWPEVDSYASRISENVGKASEATPISTPIDETPMSVETRASSYFSSAKSATDVSRHPARRRKVSAALHPSGWLSKSYVSGLMLPGEGLHHLIMCTLLENDKDAMGKLGPMANLCSGFVYARKSFWSTACVVGRVLAAGHGSAECMGWISSDIVPAGLGDGWVNIDVEEIPGKSGNRPDGFHVLTIPVEDVEKTGKKARLWSKTLIEKESGVLGDADRDCVLPADFIIPFENNYVDPPPCISVELRSLDLFAPVDSVNTTPTEDAMPTPFSDGSRAPDIHTYPSSIAFSVTEMGGPTQQYNFALSKDVYFVTAHPCVPSAHVKVVKSPSSPTIQQIDVSGGGAKTPSFTGITGHPLHKFFTYTVIHMSELLQKQSSTLDELLKSSDPTRQSTVASTEPRVLVIDCITGFTQPSPSAHDAPLSPSSPVMDRHEDKFGAAMKMHLESRRRQFGSDMEVMIRALCAEKGWNALISRRRRGCLACAIREAGALGWKVVIRVG